MRKLLAITATTASLAITIAAPSAAHARLGAGTLAEAIAGTVAAQPAQYYGGSYRPYYAPRYYRGGYYDYYRYGYSGSRDALDTCAYC
jgi:hypothetical protein